MGKYLSEMYNRYYCEITDCRFNTQKVSDHFCVRCRLVIGQRKRIRELEEALNRLLPYAATCGCNDCPRCMVVGEIVAMLKSQGAYKGH